MLVTTANLLVMKLHFYYRYPPDKNGSNPKVSELIKEVTYSIKSYADKRMQYDNAGFEVVFYQKRKILHLNILKSSRII